MATNPALHCEEALVTSKISLRHSKRLPLPLQRTARSQSPRRTILLWHSVLSARVVSSADQNTSQTRTRPHKKHIQPQANHKLMMCCDLGYVHVHQVCASPSTTTLCVKFACCAGCGLQAEGCRLQETRTTNSPTHISASSAPKMWLWSQGRLLTVTDDSNTPTHIETIPTTGSGLLARSCVRQLVVVSSWLLCCGWL